MGGSFKLDLTVDVTHLIVGSIQSEKYKHVARHRPDIQVLLPSWLEALRDAWTAGEHVPVTQLAKDHALPIFHGLDICLTGFTDLKERQRLQAVIESNGAAYHPDLTKHVSHLIAIKPEGAKYDRAKEWKIQLVAPKWLEDSLKRGMTLDESCYDPLLPLDRQGDGAYLPRPRAAKASKRDASHLQEASGPEGRRKIRRTASARLNSQSQNLWDDLHPLPVVEAPNVDDSWTQSVDAESQPPQPTAKTQPVAWPSDEQSRASLSKPTGIFSGWLCQLYGHTEQRRQALTRYLTENGAQVLNPKDSLPIDNPDQWTALVLPSEWTAQKSSSRPLPDYAATTKLVTEMWVERCLLQRRLVDPDKDHFSQALLDLPSDCFHGHTISTSGLGQDVRHIVRIVKAGGGQYEEVLSRKTTLLIHDPAKTDLEKPVYCVERDIDVVTPQWLYASLQKRSSQAVLRYYLPVGICTAIQHIVDSHKRHADKPEINAGTRSSISSNGFIGAEKRLPQKSSGQRLTGVRYGATTSLALTRTAPPQLEVRSQPVVAKPLDEVHTNSQDHARRSRTASVHARTDEESEPDVPVEGKENASPVRAAKRNVREVSEHASEVLTSMLARRQASTLTPQDAPRRKRTLGRATSGTGSASFARSTDDAYQDAGEAVPSPFDQPMASQVLSYENDLAREQRMQMAAKGIKIGEDKGRVRNQGVVKDADTGGRGSVAGRVRGRHREGGEVVVEDF